MESFKRYHGVEKEIPLDYKEGENGLFVFYNDCWIRLNYKHNLEKYYKFESIRKSFGTELCHILGIPNPRKYTHEMYLKYKESYCKASKKYYDTHKKKTN